MSKPITLAAARAALQEEARAIAAEAGRGGLASITRKLTVGEQEHYLHLGYDGRGRLVHVAITPEHNTRTDDGSEDGWRSNVAVAASMASLLLAAGLWTTADLVALWRGTGQDAERAYPCQQVGGLVGGVLDAAAKWLDRETGGDNG